jgi:hypothetical protein
VVKKRINAPNLSGLFSALFCPFFSFLPLQSKKVFHNLKNFISHWFSFGYTLFLPFSLFPRPVCFSGDFGGLKTTTKTTYKNRKNKTKKSRKKSKRNPTDRERKTIH